ncbi:MAG: hypothetical protein V7L11_07185 [Nostoc sp.]|uniref:hypothetical protein n=1 Tax=Nostoc sp. TaxID=1180 RepID=UPI002FF8EF44
MKKKPVTLRVTKKMTAFELQGFIDFVHAVDPELNPDELITLAAFIVRSLPEIFISSPVMISQVKGMAQAMKNQRK